MSSEWPAVPLEDLTDGTPITYGVVKPGEECENGVPFIRGGDVVSGRIQTSKLRTITQAVSNQYSRTLLRGGELLVSLVGNPGEVAIVAKSLAGANIARQVGLVRIDSAKADANYIQYFLRSKVGRDILLAHSKGSVQQVINLKDLKSIRIPIPPINFQRSIAAFMQALDDRITLLRETNVTLEAIAQALFKSWFVDFDPVRAKMEGRTPEGMDEATAALFPDAFEQKELGVVPRGWNYNKLSSISMVTMGLSPKGDSYNSDGVGVPLINGPVEFGDYFPVRTKWTSAAERMAKAGDLIFCVRGSTTGRRVVSDGDYCIGRGVCSIRAHNNHHSFLYQTINFGLDRLLSNTTGSVFPSLSGPDIKSFQILNPVEPVVAAFEQYVAPLVHRQQNNQVQVETLAALRNTLLPYLISGQLRVAETTIVLEII